MLTLMIETKTMKLISMTDFVLQQDKEIEYYNDFDEKYHCFNRVLKYAKLLKTPLNLGMFIPCDENGNILKDPELTMMQGDGSIYYGASDEDFDIYSQAEEKVIFEGFELVTDIYKSCKRFIIWMPDNVNQVYRNVLYPNGKNDKFFFNHYKEFTTVEDLVKFNLELKFKKALAKK